jgi:hypothetical protein
MEPEDRLHCHVNRGEEIVSASHVAHLVRENSAKLSRIEAFQELGR